MLIISSSLTLPFHPPYSNSLIYVRCSSITHPIPSPPLNLTSPRSQQWVKLMLASSHIASSTHPPPVIVETSTVPPLLLLHLHLAPLKPPEGSLNSYNMRLIFPLLHNSHLNYKSSDSKLEFDFPKLSDSELEQVKKDIRKKIISKRRTELIIFGTILIGLIIYLIIN